MAKNVLPLQQVSSKGIPDALKNFDSLPDSAGVRLPVLQGLYGCSGATVWRRVKDGTIPKPDKLSPGITSWNVGKLRAARRTTAEPPSGNGKQKVPAKPAAKSPRRAAASKGRRRAEA